MKLKLIAVAIATTLAAPLALAESGVDYDKLRQEFQKQSALYLSPTLVADDEAGVDRDDVRKAYQGQQIAEEEAGFDYDNTRRAFQRQPLAENEAGVDRDD